MVFVRTKWAIDFEVRQFPHSHKLLRKLKSYKWITLGWNLEIKKPRQFTTELHTLFRGVKCFEDIKASMLLTENSCKNTLWQNNNLFDLRNSFRKRVKVLRCSVSFLFAKGLIAWKWAGTISWKTCFPPPQKSEVKGKNLCYFTRGLAPRWKDWWLHAWSFWSTSIKRISVHHFC